MRLIEKMRGSVCECPPRVGAADIFRSWLGGFVGLAAVGLLHARLLDQTGLPLLIGSFGATAVLVYGVPHSPFAQPRNVLGGHVLSALTGVAAQNLLGATPWLAAAAAASTAIVVMHVTRTLHPPGGATALIAVIGGESVHRLGFFFALVPAGLGAIILLLIALVINNLPAGKRYPHYWL